MCCWMGLLESILDPHCCSQSPFCLCPEMALASGTDTLTPPLRAEVAHFCLLIGATGGSPRGFMQTSTHKGGPQRQVSSQP